MRISHEEQRVEIVEVVDDIICNRCGESCRHPSLSCNAYGLVEAEVSGGFGARLGDMVRYTFSICERCLEQLFDGFKHPPEITANAGWGEPTWADMKQHITRGEKAGRG